MIFAYKKVRITATHSNACIPPGIREMGND
jgi:hypothetical protein